MKASGYKPIRKCLTVGCHTLKVLKKDHYLLRTFLFSLKGHYLRVSSKLLTSQYQDNLFPVVHFCLIDGFSNVHNRWVEGIISKFKIYIYILYIW